MSDYKHIAIKLEPYQLRMLEELSELSGRIDKAHEALQGLVRVNLQLEQESMLTEQVGYMCQYCEVLQKRIKESVFDSALSQYSKTPRAEPDRV